MQRREFLGAAAAAIAGGVLCPRAALAQVTDSGVARGDVSSRGRTWVPEYAGSLSELLIVYDQCAAVHLFREIVALVRHAPVGARVHVLVSRPREEEARRRLSDAGLEAAHLVVSDEEGVSGDWGRDIFQLGRTHDGRPALGVPWNKAAARRDDLDRGWRQLRALARDDLAVVLVPAAFEGGNLMADRVDGEAVLFAGSTIAVETRALYLHYYGRDPGDDGVARILGDALGADRVVWLGTREGGRWARQSRLGFHIDMGMTLVSEGVAVVARCDPTALDRDEHRAILHDEAQHTIDALRSREANGIAWPENLALPREEDERERFLAARLDSEIDDLHHSSREFDATAARMTELGYTVHRLDTDPRRVRRYQSHTNVIVSADRMIMPIFPTHDRVHGWVLEGEHGRDQIDVAIGIGDSDFELTGDNLAAFELFRSLHPEVRVVRDYFFLASGNVHCVVGRLG